MKLTGDIDVDSKMIIKEFTERGFEGLKTCIVLETIPAGHEFKRNTMQILLPLMLSCVVLGMRDGITADDLIDEDFRKTLKILATTALAIEIIKGIHKNELKDIMIGVNNTDAKT